MNNQRISLGQAVFLILATIYPTAMLTVPKVVGKYSAQNGWISCLIALVIALAVAWIVTQISIWSHPFGGFFPSLARLFGKRFQKGIAGFLFIYYFLSGFYVLSQFQDFMSAVIMPDTPSMAFLIVLMFVVIYGLSKGIEVIARVNALFFTLSFMTFGITVFLVLKELEWNRLLPIADTPLPNLIMGGYTPLAWFSEVSIIWILHDHLNGKFHRKATMIGLLLTGILLTGTIIFVIALVGSDFAQLLNYPTFIIFEKIEVAKFITRIDSVFVTIWIGTMMMKSSLFFYGAMVCIKYMFSISPRGPVLVPVTVLGILYAVTSWDNTPELTQYSSYTFPLFAFIFNIFLPLLLLGLFALKRKQYKKQREVPT